MHAIKLVNNAGFVVFNFLTAANEGDHHDACKIGKINQELQKDFLCTGSQFPKFLSPPPSSLVPLYLILDHSKSQQ